MKSETIIRPAIIRYGLDKKKNQIVARSEFALHIASIDPDEATAAFSVRLPDVLNRERTFDVISFEGHLWRPIAPSIRNGNMSAYDILTGNLDDNPLTKAISAANGHKSMPFHFDHYPVRDDDTPQRRTVERALDRASSEVMLVGGVAYRTCHEPTWIVRRLARHDNCVIVQPDLGEPGRTIDAVWFSSERREDAIAFAREIAERSGFRLVEPRGEITASGILAPDFDDRLHAEARVEAIWSPANIALAGLFEHPEFASIASERAAAAPGSSEASDLAEIIKGRAEGIDEPGPAVALLLERSELPCAHLDFLRERLILRRDDAAALDAIDAMGL